MVLYELPVHVKFSCKTNTATVAVTFYNSIMWDCTNAASSWLSGIIDQRDYSWPRVFAADEDPLHFQHLRVSVESRFPIAAWSGPGFFRAWPRVASLIKPSKHPSSSEHPNVPIKRRNYGVCVIKAALSFPDRGSTVLIALEINQVPHTTNHRTY